MRTGVLVCFEYAQAFLLLIYYWLKSLARLLLVKPVRKNITKEIVLVTGAGEFLIDRSCRDSLSFVVRAKGRAWVEVSRDV